MEEQKVEALKKISESIAKALSALDNPPAHNGFAAWAAKCQIYYDNQQEYEHNYQSHTITRQLPAPIPTLTQPRSPAGNPMDLDLLNKMKAEERQRCYTNRLCFYCKAPGHDVDNCEKKKIADARRFSGQTSRGCAGFRGQGAPTGREATLRRDRIPNGLGAAACSCLTPSISCVVVVCLDFSSGSYERFCRTRCCDDGLGIGQVELRIVKEGTGRDHVTQVT
jgi:hypothetical protein